MMPRLLSVLLIVALLSPSLLPAIVLAQSGGDKQEAGDEGEDAAAAAEAAAEAAAQTVNEMANLTAGLEGRSFTASSVGGANFDANNPSVNITADTGETFTMTTDQAISAAGAIGDAQAAGISTSNSHNSPGVDVAATLEAHSQGETGVVVGSMSGEIGTPAEVARAEIAAAGRQSAVSALTDLAFDSRWAGAVPIQGNSLNQALAAAYGQLADSARQAGILGLGGTTQLTSQGTGITQNTINSYQQYAEVMGQSGNLSLSGTTNTSYSYDRSTGSWVGDQNGRTYTTQEVVNSNKDFRDAAAEFEKTSDRSYADFFQDAVEKDSGRFQVSLDFRTNQMIATDIVTGQKTGTNLTTGTTENLGGIFQSYDSTTGTNLGQTPPAGTSLSFTPTGLGNYQIADTKTVAPKESFVGAHGTKLSDSAARAMLESNVTIKDGVSFEGARASTVATANQLAKDCNCVVPVTSVTDGKHAGGPNSHGNGAKFDVSNWRSPEFTEYVTGGKNGWTQTGTRGGAHGGPIYTNPEYPGVNIVHEKGYYHFDIQVNGDVGKSGLEITYATGSIFEGSLHVDLPPGESLNVGLPAIPGGNETSVGSQGGSSTAQPSGVSPDTGRSLPDIVADGMDRVGLDPNSGIGRGVMGLATVADNLLGRFGIDFNDLMSGDGTAPGNESYFQGDDGVICPYPLSCDNNDLGASAIMAIAPNINIFSWASWIWSQVLGDRQTTITPSLASKPADVVMVEIVAHLSDNAIDIHRPDIDATMENPRLHYTNEQYDRLISLLNEEPILTDSDGSIVYSNGLYSPPVIDGRPVEGSPRYVYVLKQTDENGNDVAIDETAEPGGLLARVLKQVFGNTSPFGLDSIDTVSYRLIDPDIDTPADEYYDYVFTLKDGSERAVAIPQFSSVAHMAKKFRDIGYQGTPLDILNLATETNLPPESGLAGKLLDWIKDSISRFISSPTDDQTTTTLPETKREYSVANIANIFIYPNAAVSCPDVAGYQDGYMYTATINDPDRPGYMTLVTEGRCGNGDEADFMADALRQLEDRWGFTGAIADSTVDKVRFRFEETPYNPGLASVYVGTDTPSGSTDLEPATSDPGPTATSTTQLPNLTNTITFEVKAVGSNGNVLADWSQAERITVAPGVQLYFRWNGTDYQQCLPYLNDNGNYALTVRNRAMTTGNTENEGYNINERSGVYRIECGGQRNNEFGVDAREIEVEVR